MVVGKGHRCQGSGAGGSRLCMPTRVSSPTKRDMTKRYAHLARLRREISAAVMFERKDATGKGAPKGCARQCRSSAELCDAAMKSRGHGGGIRCISYEVKQRSPLACGRRVGARGRGDEAQSRERTELALNRTLEFLACRLSSAD